MAKWVLVDDQNEVLIGRRPESGLGLGTLTSMPLYHHFSLHFMAQVCSLVRNLLVYEVEMQRNYDKLDLEHRTPDRLLTDVKSLRMKKTFHIF